MVWAISADDPQRLREYRDREAIELPILLDPDLETIKRYGLLNPADRRGIPHPTAIIVDRGGVVRYMRIDVNFRERPAVGELLEFLEGL